MKLMNVKGTSDSLPKEELIKRRVVNTLTSTFEKFGYMPLDTTILCYYDLLASKYAGGSEILKEVYTLNDQGDRKLGLRYDLTVPFSKVISMNVNKNITLPLTTVLKIEKEEATKQAEELLKKMNLLEKRYSYPYELSGGERQRVAIAIFKHEEQQGGQQCRR